MGPRTGPVDLGVADRSLVGACREAIGRQLILGVAVGLAIALVSGCSDGTDDDASPSTTDPASAATDPATGGPAAIEPARDFSAPGIAVVAHRGASAEAPEHTFAAYDLAVEQGADYLEQDLQLTADGVLVVVHDPALERTARGPADRCTGPVTERTLADLDACEVGSWFNEANPELADPAYTDQPIPTMADVFDRYGSDVRYYIEIKSPDEQPGIEEALLDLLDDAGIEATDGDLPPVVIQSFSPESLRRLHDLRPELPLVQLISVVTGPPLEAADLDDIATYAVAIGPASLLVDDDLVAAANERCLDVHPYTVDDPDEMADLLATGVGAMFSNVPGVLRDEAEGEPGPTLCSAPATTP